MGSDNNLKLWERVEKTNPGHTKQVKLGRAITAIDPYQQIKNATAEFGPAGEGWGWSVEQVITVDATKEVAVLVRVWHGSNGKFIEHFGQNGMYIDNAQTKVDTDCFKKAVTDGLTKCLSCLGFNADIFLGKFDDNKYVKAMEEEFGETQGTSLKQSPEKPWYNDFNTQKDWMQEQINKGHLPQSILDKIQETYKVNKKVREEILSLKASR